MNKETAKDFLPLVQALAEGKTIQYFDGESWNDAASLLLAGEPKDYRIKPEPREFVIQSIWEVL